MARVRSFLLVTATVVTLSACGSDPEADSDSTEARPAAEAVTGDGTTTATDRRVIRIESMSLSPQEFDDVVELTGTVDADDDATLSARSAGTIVSIKPLGASVAAGYAVAQIDPGIAQASLDQVIAQRDVAAAQLDLTEDLFKRQEPLYRDSIISSVEFQQVRAQLAQARAQHTQAEALVKQAQEQLNQTMITSPFSGVVEEHFVENGEQVAPGTRVVRVVNTSRVRVEAGIPERYAGDIKVGARARLRFNSYGVPPMDSRVSFVGSAINAGSRTFPIEIELDNRNGSLKPEMIAEVLVTRGVLSDAIVIPQSAVLRDEQGTSVYVVDRSGSTPQAERRVVTLGPSYGGKVVISSGLQGGDELITVGANSVAPGDAVETVRSGSRTEAL